MPLVSRSAATVAGGEWAIESNARSGSTIRGCTSRTRAFSSRQAANSCAIALEAPWSWRLSRSFHHASRGSVGPRGRASRVAHSSSAQLSRPRAINCAEMTSASASRWATSEAA